MAASMSTKSNPDWLDEILPSHHRLTKAVVSIVENLLRERDIDYLAVTGRTKDKRAALEKITRKGYAEPTKQLTDLSGIRVVVYFESDVQKVGALIEQAFTVDKANSLDKDSLLSTNQIGYRSVHYVCDLGKKRQSVDEYSSISTLKFEFQVRTVLQHAWAELAHDRNYKFSGKLPKELERKLYLYAGLLEIADKGFDETAKAVDHYAKSLQTRTAHGDLDIEITSLSLEAFVSLWSQRTKFPLDNSFAKSDLSDLIQELREFGITKLHQLNAIVPPNYASVAKKHDHIGTIYGVVRDWMLVKDWRRFVEHVSFSWVMDQDNILVHILGENEYAEMMQRFEVAPTDEDI
jgi:putative GTP pyrophosphokinase